ncbi:cystatin-B [Trichinella spiralis]|uniref:cystatin-B n=1 Tax=Trichinella spiralis TaxID=6334 RepID=UPI0001EFCDC6|nr:cystatin-B [Trichinella spiralis]
MSNICGGVKEEREPTEAETAIALGLRSDVENQLNRKFKHFRPVSIRTQIVAGINYFFKVMVDEDDFIHLRVFKNLQNETQLHGVQHEVIRFNHYYLQNISKKLCDCFLKKFIKWNRSVKTSVHFAYCLLSTLLKRCVIHLIFPCRSVSELSTF